MNIFFFRDSAAQALDFVKGDSSACCMWYTKGLTSYNDLGKFIGIGKIFVESSIFAEFTTDNPALCAGITPEVVAAAQGDDSHSENKPLCFFASNDTIVRSFKPILDLLGAENYKLFCRGNENAEKAAKSLNLTAIPVTNSIPDCRRYSLLVLGNDWGPREELINNQFQSNGINTVCIQESSIDFHPKGRRMRQCSFPIFQGAATLENIDVRGRILAIIGNPRFEDLRPAKAPTNELALVNVNFTYGIHEDVRDSWVKDVVDSCNSLGIDYLLSQHPRDKGDLSKYKVLKSNPLLVHDSIINSSVVISRFSALLTEAICLGRPAIYYNPHREDMHYKFTTDNIMFFHVHSKEELISALKTIRENSRSLPATKSSFVADHLGISSTGKASKVITDCLRSVSRFGQLKRKPTFLEKSVLRGKIAKRILTGNSY